MTNDQDEPLIALPLVLPMGWKNSPPIFSTATETIADLTNQRLSMSDYQPKHHHLDDLAADVILPYHKRLNTFGPNATVAVPIT